MTHSKPILNIITLFLVLALIYGCAKKREPEQTATVSSEPMVLLIKNPADEVSMATSAQLVTAFYYANIPYLERDIPKDSGDFHIAPSIRLIYITTSQVEKLDDREVRQLLTFVGRGNHLIILAPLYDNRFDYFTGLDPTKAHKQDSLAQGFSFKEHVFPNSKGSKFKPSAKYLHYGFTGSSFTSDMEVIATAFNDPDYPAIIKRTIGYGDVVYFNSSTMNDKEYRGLVFSAGMRALQGIPYRIANEATIFLDDFPAPLYDKKLPPVKEEYDMTHAEFIKKVWWPDMKALADTFDLKYTTMLAFNYNANVVPPFDFNEWLNDKLDGPERYGTVRLAQDVAKTRHELGFHGYNHFSLWRQDWQNQQFMISALQAAKKRWKIDQLGRLPITYVPPTNQVDSLGLDAIRKTIPSLRIMSSLYLGDPESGEGREFGPDPYVKHFFDYPRITSGYVDNESNFFKQQNLLILTGIWTHFLHPDDVFQVKQRGDFASRNPLGLGWKSDKNHDYGLYHVFRERIIQTQSTYPCLRFNTAGEAVNIVKKWLNTRSHYRVDNDKLEVTTTSQKSAENNRKFWFMYVQNSDTSTIDSFLGKQNISKVSSPWWKGKLFQFATTGDTLTLPILDKRMPAPKREKIDTDSLIAAYKKYTEQADRYREEKTGETKDHRLQDALQALGQQPDSYKLQERVINLSVELDSIRIAIPLLEKRLLNNPSWRTNDIERLLTYYGWSEQQDRAFEFLEKLWEKYHDQSTIKFEDMMVSRYGLPDNKFRTLWLHRRLQLNPENESVLHELITADQTEENWPETKQYLRRLIQIHPQSDSLYLYLLRRSFYYDSARTTLHLIENFPEQVKPQLEPLSPDIANLYAYTANDYSEALRWADRTDEFPIRAKLEWLIQQKRYQEFMHRSDRYLADHPSDDSLREFAGRQLIYEGYPEEGYKRLYPVFEAGGPSVISQKLVHSEIGYQPYEDRMPFYKNYPAFFSDSLRADLIEKYRINEGIKAGPTGSYANDNFNNSIGRMGAFVEWGRRQKYTHHLLAEEAFVGSDVGISSLTHRLPHIFYRYQQKYRNESVQSTMGGGLYQADSRIRPELNLGLSYSVDSTFTSGEINFGPVFTNSAIQQKISQLRANVYRDDFWRRGNIQTDLSLQGTWYSNDVYSYEALLRVYVQLPFSTAYLKVRPIAEFSYSDASRSYLSGVPYYTPDQLFVKGAGAEFSYKDLLSNPRLSFQLEALAKHDNMDGFFSTSSARFNARIRKYLELSIHADFSSSTVYRYNNVGFTVSYTLPKHLYSK